jgi:hypothetical protein
MYWEGQFAQPGIGYDALSGYTYDGHPIDYDTGELYGIHCDICIYNNKCIQMSCTYTYELDHLSL